MAKTPCIECGAPAPGTRCDPCARAKAQTYNAAWQAHSRRTRAEWVAAYGWQCPGWDRDPHPSTDLVVDHDVGVLCRSCNAIKANTHDRLRAISRQPPHSTD